MLAVPAEPMWSGARDISGGKPRQSGFAYSSRREATDSYGYVCPIFSSLCLSIAEFSRLSFAFFSISHALFFSTCLSPLLLGTMLPISLSFAAHLTPFPHSRPCRVQVQHGFFLQRTVSIDDSIAFMTQMTKHLIDKFKV